jgi:tetratricopeptide (TPR) repeat protein
METCTLCQRTIPDGEPSVWRHDSGVSVSVATSAEPIVFIDTPSGELWVCERCYLAALPSSLSPAQLQSLHAQFAIEYRDHHRFANAVRAGERALEFGQSADVLAELAYVHSELGLPTDASALYRRALAIEPNHFMATENLKSFHANGSA